MSILNDIRQFAQDPHSYAAGQTQASKRFANRLYQLTQPRKRARLHNLLEMMTSSPCHCSMFGIADQQGYTLFDARHWDLAARAMAEARGFFLEADLKTVAASMAEQQPFTQIAWQPERESPIVELATHECFLRPIGAYFGTLPILRHVQLVYSPNDRVVDGSSQYYHLDGQDVRSLHVFVFIEDVTQENGPLTLIDADSSAAVCHAVAYRKSGKRRRLTDTDVSALLPAAAKPREMIGPAGSILMFDGDRCLHYGSRRATRPRFVLNMFYTSAFSFTLRSSKDCALRECGRREDPLWKQVVLGTTTV